MSFQITGPGWEMATQAMLDNAVVVTGDLENVRSLIHQRQFNELADMLDEDRFNFTEFVTDAVLVVSDNQPQLWFKISMVQ
jgi:hypothetical protein